MASDVRDRVRQMAEEWNDTAAATLAMREDIPLVEINRSNLRDYTSYRFTLPTGVELHWLPEDGWDGPSNAVDQVVAWALSLEQQLAEARAETERAPAARWTAMSERETAFWGFADDERLTHTDPDEVMEYWLDDAWPTPPEDLPAELEVIGFAHIEPDPENCTGTPLERLLDYLDETYGDPDAMDYTRPTEKMRAAELAFVRSVLDEYEVWQCEPVDRVTVNVAEWIAKNAPDYAADCQTDRAKRYREKMAAYAATVAKGEEESGGDA